MPNPATFDIVLGDVKKEMKRAEEMHGPIPADLFRALAILTEEVGEAAEACLELARPIRDPGTRAGEGGESVARRRQKEHLLEEVTQITAVAFRWLCRLEEEGYEAQR